MSNLETMLKNIDIYCERTDATFWSEPVNALTNIAFLVAAFFAYKAYKQGDSSPRGSLALVMMLAVIGIGSFLFHTFANTISMFADIIPIVIFILISFYIITRSVLGFSPRKTILFYTLFILINYASIRIFGRHALNGSIQYIPTLLTLAALTIISFKTAKDSAKCFFIAVCAITTSVYFRSIDMDICQEIPLGSHYMWHLLNGLGLYFVVKGVLKTRKS